MKIRFALLFGLLFSEKAGLPAQSSRELHRFDALIDRYFETPKTDSFLFFSKQKMAAARRLDSLAAWAWTKQNVQNQFAENPEKALVALDEIAAEKWREPRSADEWEPFMWAAAGRGWHLFQLGRVWESIEAYRAAEAIFEQFRYPDFDPTEYLWKAMGSHFTRLGDNEKALLIYQKALDFTQKTGDRSSLAGIYSNIGTAEWNAGDFAAAEKSFRAGLKIGQIEPTMTGLLWNGLARTLLDLGRPAEAFSAACKSLRPFSGLAKNDPTAHEYRAASGLTAGLAAAGIGRVEEAVSFYKKALVDAEIAFGKGIHRDKAKIETAISAAFLMKKQPAAALESANRALIFLLPKFQPTAPIDLPTASDFYPENAIGEALRAKAAAAEALSGEKNDLLFLKMALDCHDLAWRADAVLRQVLMYQSAKLGIQHSAREADERAMQTARLLFEKTGDAAFAERGFAIAERSKAAILTDALHENLVRQRLAAGDSRFEKLDKLRQNAAWLEREILLETGAEQQSIQRLALDRLRTEAADLEREISGTGSALPLFSDVENGLAGHSTGFAGGEILLEFFEEKDAFNLFIRTENGQIAWKIIAKTAEFTQLLTRFNGFFASAGAIGRDPAAYFSTAFELYKKLIPAEAEAAEKWLIVPDGAASFIPFEALLTEAASGLGLRHAPFLLKKHAVRYAWSLATLRRQEVLRSDAGQFFLGLAPRFQKKERGLAPLLADKNEWAEIPGAAELLGENATREAFLSQAAVFQILHLSTHAQAAEPSRIEFIDQPIWLPDIYALHLRAELVVLSACETGIGSEKKGEGVMSLSRAFACAGARSLVASLWSVNDRSTGLLFANFYRNLRAGQSKSEALRQAKLDYLAADGPDALKTPWFWAAFSLSGADGPVEMESRFPKKKWAWLLAGLVVLLAGWFSATFLFSKRTK